MTSIFVTGAAGYIGSSFVRQALAANYQVNALTRSEASAKRLQQMGATPIIGDLARAEVWPQVVAQSEMIVHLAQPDTYGARVTAARAQAYGEKRLQMDTLLLKAINRDTIRRVVFVCGTSYYGHQGDPLRSEDASPNPKGWGPYIAPAIEALKGYAAQGLPIVEAFPGWVYGPASWFAEYQLVPLSKRRPVMRLAGRPQVVSPVHVEDVARALLHLLEHGQGGQRYFIVDDRSVPSTQMVAVAARALGVPGRILPLPWLFCRLAMGPIITESMTCDFRLSNQKLKSLGFALDYPDIEAGIPDVVRRWRASLV